MREMVVDVRAVAVAPSVPRSPPVAATRPGVAVIVWAVGGIGLTFVEAIYRLGARALATIDAGLTLSEWSALAVGVIVLSYAEGYRALQKRFVPLVIERALSPEVDYARSPVSVLLAPLHAVGLAGASRGATLRAYASVGLIVAAVLLVRGLPDPWRGIVDAAVTVALSWGLVALMTQLVRVLRGVGTERRQTARETPERTQSTGGSECP